MNKVYLGNTLAEVANGIRSIQHGDCDEILLHPSSAKLSFYTLSCCCHVNPKSEDAADLWQELLDFRWIVYGEDDAPVECRIQLINNEFCFVAKYP